MLFMIQISWVPTPVILILGCIVFLSKSYLNQNDVPDGRVVKMTLSQGHEMCCS